MHQIPTNTLFMKPVRPLKRKQKSNEEKRLQETNSPKKFMSIAKVSKRKKNGKKVNNNFF